jgi:hypothetical protein
MIVYDLSCQDGHKFEGWFGSSDDFADQRQRGLLSCPQCGSTQVKKAVMAPAVSAKGNTKPDTDAGHMETQPVSNKPMPEEVQKALAALAKAQDQALKQSTWVGDTFAEKSRAMHYGEADEKLIHGQATPEEAQDLVDEGIAVAPLPFPVAPPDKLN